VKQIEEPTRTVPVMAETDVLVVGSGPGGLAAALAAAREGVDTMLVERYGCFGGNITQAHVASIAWYRYERTVEAGGIGVEFERRADEMGASQTSNLIEYLDADTLAHVSDQLANLPNPPPASPTLDADMFKYVADKMVQEAGIIPLLHCLIVQVVMEGSTIKGVITESKSGRQAILAKRVIDATGDADIAYHAGAPCRKAPKNELMEVSMNFGCSGVDIARFLGDSAKNLSYIRDWAKETAGKEDDELSSYMVEPFNKARQAGEIPEDVKIESYWTTVTPLGEVKNLNAVDMGGIDATDVWDLTKAEMEGRQRAIWALNALKKHKPGFENARLRTFGSSVGVRESRKIVGAYNITEQDVRNEARFDDSIGIFPEFLDAYGVVILPTTGRFFQVPYGVILPQNVENLLVAGRCVAGDKVSHAATRQMMCCAVTGQGAGVAAATSLKDNVSCSEVDILKVQKALRKQGVRLE
jgi:hypothetical protein